MSDLMQKFASLNGAKFVGINGYTNKAGEVSNQVINCNVNIENAKKADLETLKNITEFELGYFAGKAKVSDKAIAIKALDELIASAERNLTADNRTASSVAQTDAYTQLGKGIKFHNETGDLYISGFANNKTILVEGEYKTVNSQPKTLVKKEISKTLKMAKFRSFRLSNIGRELHVTGSTVQL